MSVHVRLTNVSLEVPIFLQKERETRGWGGMLLSAAFDVPRRETRTLLEDVSFEAGPGDRVALLGLNGAGKSTLLRVLNNVYQPTRGRVDIAGTRQALLNISLGFNGEATVRENIFLRGTAMGMKSALIRELIDPILDFAGLGAKVNHRLNTLSAGQRMRLGFAISTATQHDIMIMDEWVGAGDAEFMAKAKERLQSRVAGSKIVILASHSLGLLRDVCNRGIILDGGRLVYSGDIADALGAYANLVSKAQAGGTGGPGDHLPTTGCAEQISLEGGVVTVRGWALRGFVTMPSLLALEVRGQYVLCRDYRKLARPDVQAHFGLSDPVCGFEAEFPVPGLQTLGELQLPFLMAGGESQDDLGDPFRVAVAIQNVIGKSTPRPK